MPLSYGQRYFHTYGVSAALARIDHLRKRMEDEPTNTRLGEEADNIGRALLTLYPSYDWTTNTIPNSPAPTLTR